MRTGDLTIHAVLNESLVSGEFAKRMPQTFQCRRCDTEYFAPVPREIFNPDELQFGWQKGDILYWNGWLILDTGEDGVREGLTMVIGHMSEYELLRGQKDSIKLRISLQETERPEN